MKKLINLLSVATLVALLILSLSNDLFAQRQRPNRDGGRQHPAFGQQHGGFWSELNEEQKQALQQKIEELRASGASREEIHAVVVEMLEGWGIEAPERPGDGQRNKRFGGGRDGIFSRLTEDQRKAVHDKIEELHGQDVSREEISAAIAELLQSWGIDVPQDFGKRFGRRGHHENPLFAQLTEEQKQTIKTKMDELRAQDISREEITAAIAELLTSWGIDVPENFGERFGRRGPQGNPLFAQLSEEQRKAIQGTIQELRSHEVPREEIAAAVAEMLEGWGIEVPEGFVENFGKHRPRFPFPGIWQQLSEEQKQVIKDLTATMRENGATRMEIRQAVREKLEEFGFELPERGKGQRPGQPEPHKQGKLEKQGKGQFNAKNYPNPFNPETNIQYTLQNPEYVSLKIYNMQGQLIRSLISENQGVGDYSVKWDGTNDTGTKVVSGVYIYKLNVGKDTFSEKLMLMK
ncbi:T9SS type A sorting domain-containing protein [candidate division KSB1 bacterium]|nr:T9SS type A sorting domain-containing protein [candidate division KSB1 bacterium]MBL7092714.1 T9SS type A sorting domain-containing protein [candidate division KSB1 bacterium]